MSAMDVSVAWRAALIQGAAVAVIAFALGATVSREFFEDYGWAAGPGAWAACALLTAAVLRLPLAQTLGGAALAGLPGLVGVIAGVHWLGPPLGVVLFGLWCGRLAAASGVRLPVVA